MSPASWMLPCCERFLALVASAGLASTNGSGACRWDSTQVKMLRTGSWGSKSPALHHSPLHLFSLNNLDTIEVPASFSSMRYCIVASATRAAAPVRIKDGRIIFVHTAAEATPTMPDHPCGFKGT
jgi:hypothetical protein